MRILLNPMYPFFWIILVLVLVFGGRAVICPESGEPDPQHLRGTYSCPDGSSPEELEANTNAYASGAYANPLGGTSSVKINGSTTTYKASEGRTVTFTTQADGSIFIEAKYGMGTMTSLVSAGGESAALANLSTMVTDDPYFANYLYSLSGSYPSAP